MERDERLVRLSREHTQALMVSLRLDRELPTATDEDVGKLYADLIAFWSAGLLPHFRAEGECLLARLLRHLDHDHPDMERFHRDHLDLERLVIDMRDAGGSAERRTVLEVFGARLREHVRWEEERLFPLAEQQLTEAELNAAGSDLAERLPEHPLAFTLSPGGIPRRSTD